jgi:hypothetical protein
MEDRNSSLIALATNLCAGSIILFGLASCSSANQPAASDQTSMPGAISQAGQSEVQAPGDFAFPIYPGATKVHWEPYDSNLPVPRYHVQFHSDAPKEKVVEFYTAKVKELGWELQGEITNVGDLTLITANKGKVNASIQINKEDGGNGLRCAIITSQRNQ